MNFKIVVVDDDYNLLNGLVNLNRNVVLRLCDLMLLKTVNIRMVIGMCSQFYLWKTHELFVFARKKYMFPPLMPNGDCDCNVSVTNKKMKCSFQTKFNKHLTVFLETLIVKGVWQWTVQISYGSEYGSLFFGVSSSRSVAQLQESFLGQKKTDSCSLEVRQCSDKNFLSFLYGIGQRGKRNSITDNSFVTMEVDMRFRTLCFFVAGDNGGVKEKIPYSLERLPASLYYGISGEGHSSFVSVSLRRLACPTPSHVRCGEGLRKRKRR